MSTQRLNRSEAAGGIVLLSFILVGLFVGGLFVFGLLTGYSVGSLFAPLVENLWVIVAVGGGIVLTGVTLWGIVPALRAYWNPAARTDRAVTAGLIAERDAAEKRARTAEAHALDAEQVNASLCAALEEAYKSLYDTSKGGQLDHLQMIRALRTDLFLTRDANRQHAATIDHITTERDNAVRERNELRTALTDALNTPPPSVPWTVILPWVSYARTVPTIGVRRLRDDLRAASIPIPEKEMGEFSAAVRVLPIYSPVGGGVKEPVVSPVKTEITPHNMGVHGRPTPATDGRTRSRTRRTPRTKALPTATARGKVKVDA